MRLCVPLCWAGTLLAQSTTTIYTTDVNGRRVNDATFDATKTGRTEKNGSLNGRRVPLQQTEERVLRDDANGKTTETLTRKYDPNGQLISVERTVTEQQKLAGGGSNTRATTYQTDLNGREQLLERRNTESRVSGATTTSQTTVDRPTLNGSLETVEKASAVTQGNDARKTTTENVYRRGQNGQFVEAVRRSETDTKQGNQSTQSKDEYEPDVTGTMRLKNRTVAVTNAETTRVDIYSPSVDGRVQENGAAPQIKEQQVITRSKTPDGSVVESLSVRRPTIADPNRLGDLQKISETVCTGKCEP